MVLATHACSVVVSFHRAGETSHLILAVVRRAVPLSAASIESTNGRTQAGRARWLSNLHPWREGILQENATGWVLVVQTVALVRCSADSRVRAAADASAWRDGVSPTACAARCSGMW